MWALIFTACCSRHCFVWLSYSQTTPAVIAGFEAAWRFFLGVFAVVIPDNMKPIVNDTDPLEPRLNDAFLDYAQAGAGAHPGLVEGDGDAAFGVVVEEPVDLGDDFGGGAAGVGGGQRERKGEAGGLSAFESYVRRCGRFA